MAQPYILSTACRPEKSSVVNSTSEVSQSDKPSADQAALYAAIDSATLDRVRTVLREICTENPQAFQSACDKLLLNVGTKRKRGPTQQRYEICVQCGEEYDVLSNNDKACVWHPGRTEPDYDGDFWADHDEDCHGIIDSEELREEYPEGYIWDCCEKKGDEEGCRVDAHAPDLGKRVRVVV